MKVKQLNRTKIFHIALFFIIATIFYGLVESEMGFYLSAIERGYTYPILKIGLAITIAYLLYCITHITFRLYQKGFIDKHIIYLQLKLVLGQVILMLVMFFVRMK